MATLITADAETFFDPKNGYGLLQIGNEPYICDKRFAVHGWAVAVGSDPGVWMTHKEFVHWAGGIDWTQVMLAGHNLTFDGAILAWRYGIIPAFYVDTLGMANAFIKPYTGSVSLARCNLYLDLPVKGDLVRRCAGLTTQQIIATPGLYEALGAYAIEDLAGPREIFRRYWSRLADSEKKILDWTIRNYVRGRLKVDMSILAKSIDRIEAERTEFLQELGLDDDGDSLRSATKLAALLFKLGVDVQYKTGKEGDIPAIAKKDDFMQALLVHPDPKVRLLAKARLAFSSSIEKTRSLRILKMALATKGTFHPTLIYSSARTGRFGGGGGANPQNFGRESPIRDAIHAPEGKRTVTADASQIEARIVAWLAGCKPLLRAFAEGRDPYSEFASILFRRVVTKASDPDKRQVGKVCILQLGYQSGADKLRRKLLEDAIEISPEQAQLYVDTYRHNYREIPQLWKDAEGTMRQVLITRQPAIFRNLLVFTTEGIRLPSTRWILLSNLSLSSDNQPQFWDPKIKRWISYYGGRIVENCCQSIARDATFEAMLPYLEETVLQTHDDFTQVVPEEIAEQRLAETIATMSRTPHWAVSPLHGPLPLAAEGRVSTSLAKG